MVAGVGVDVVEIGRIERAMRRPRFVPRILTRAERAICSTPSRIAGRWAAKEAAAKALGRALRWHDLEVLQDPDGRPVAAARPGVLPSGSRLHLSITHERHLAAAVAVLELAGDS